MTAARWAEIEAIAADALERPRGDRSVFLDGACRGDESLRREVESLLGYELASARFLEGCALDEAARACAHGEPIALPGFDILEFLGSGGMGEVYRARDLHLDREVALKIIWAAADETGADRVEDEARAASRLNHPNVVTIHDVGSWNGASYIVMELVRGQTIAAMVAEGSLSTARAMDIAGQLAEGLAHAHAVGIVHRDLKPENVMVSLDGRVKILDFGIAKRMQGGETAGRAAWGTAGYMAPEQAAGRPVDFRADQFSYGVIVDELLAGHPGPLAEVVQRCLRDDPRQRYADTRELAAAVTRARAELARSVDGFLTRRHFLWFAAASVATVGGFAWWRFVTPGSAGRRLAVLPFTNTQNDENSEYLCDGIADVLIRQLARLSGLTVIARSTVFQLKGDGSEPRSLGKRLGVDAVLTGTVARRGGRTRVTAELVDVASGARVWGDSYDRSDADVIGIQDDIAGAIIADGLGRRLDDATRRQLARGFTADADAYALFLRAVHELRLESEDNYLRAQALLGRALERDRTFALAYVTLASTYSVMAVDGFAPPAAAWAESRRNVDRAMAQDATLPDAHAERAAEAFFYNWDWGRAEAEWKAALGSRRGEIQAELLSSYVLQQWALGHYDEALEFARSAREVDPLSAMLAVREADLLLSKGQLDAAARVYAAVIDATPDEQRAYLGLADVHRRQGRYDETLAIWRRVYGEDDHPLLARALASAKGADGCRDVERAVATHELELLDARRQAGLYVSSLDVARGCARLGDGERAFRFLDAAFDERAAGLVFLNVDRVWDGVRHDARFDDARRRVGLA